MLRLRYAKNKGSCKYRVLRTRMPRTVLRACPCQSWMRHRMLVPIRWVLAHMSYPRTHLGLV